MSSGAGVILTRAPEDNAELAAELRAHGIDVLELPCLSTEHLTDPTRLSEAIRALGPEDRLVFTSRAGVDAARRCVRADEVRAPVAAIGGATAARCKAWGIAAWTPSEARGSVLGRELSLGEGDVLLVRADRADDEVVVALERRGARVRELVAYRVVVGARGDVVAARRAALAGAAVVVASPSAVLGIAEGIGPRAFASARLLAIGATTARAAAASGNEPRILRAFTADEVLRELEVPDVAHR